MKKNHPTNLLASGMLIAAVCLLFPFCTKAPKAVMASGSISAEELQKAFLTAKADEIPLYIYLVKKNPEVSTEDVELFFLSADANNKAIPVGRLLGDEAFTQECTSYAAFLKEKGVPEDSAALVYHVMVNKEQVKNDAKLEVSIYPFSTGDRFFMVAHHNNIAAADTLYKTGAAADSGGVCKYPPDCNAYYLPLSSVMKAVLNKTYK